MAITLGSNISALQAQQRLGRVSSDLATVYERLASGQRINKGSDDAAGLAIADSLRSDTRVYSQAMRNINDAISGLNVAGGAFAELQSVITRQKELAEQSANGVYANSQRTAMQNEVTALRDEFNRIIEGTEFNGLKLLDNPDFSFTVQTGYGVENAFEVRYALEASRDTGDGTIASYTSSTIANNYFGGIATDINADGKLDFITSGAGAVGFIRLMIGNGDGTFSNGGTFANGQVNSAYQLAYNDLNGDGIKDIATANHVNSSVSVLLGNSNGTFGAAQVYSTNDGGNGQNRSISIADITGDGINDLVSGDLFTDAFWVMQGNGNGTFTAPVSQTGTRGFDSELYDFDGDGDLDMAIGYDGAIKRNDGTGTFSHVQTLFQGMTMITYQVDDINRDGNLDIIGSGSNGSGGLAIALGNGNGTFQAAQSFSVGSNDIRGLALGDLNDDGISDLALGDTTDLRVHTMLGNGDGTFQGPISTLISGDTRNVYIADFNNDFINEILSAPQSNNIYNVLFQNEAPSIKQGVIDISTAESARRMLDKLDIDQNRVVYGQSSIGVAQSRLETKLNNLTSARLSFQEAESRIRDADIAQEAANLVRLQITQQVSAQILGQANLQPQLALSLLRA